MVVFIIHTDCVERIVPRRTSINKQKIYKMRYNIVVGYYFIPHLVRYTNVRLA